MKLVKKVSMSDLTTLLGLIIADDKNKLYYIDKTNIDKYTYDNAKLTSKGNLLVDKKSMPGTRCDWYLLDKDLDLYIKQNKVKKLA